MAGCERAREDGKLSHSKPGSHLDDQYDGGDAGDDDDADGDGDGDDQAVRAAIEKMAEEGEVYTGVFTQVTNHQHGVGQEG